MNPCTFVTLAGPADARHVDRILDHLLRMCSFDFQEVILVLDDVPKTGIPADAWRELYAKIERLAEHGPIDRVVRLSEINRRCRRLSKKHFGRSVSRVRDLRGVPLFGWIAGLEEARTDFVVWFDSDILLHQETGFNWIESGMALIADDPTVMFVAPHPGPPASDGNLRGQTIPPIVDGAGNFRFKTFSSRRFLISKQRFENMLPIRLVYAPGKNRMLSRLGLGKAPLPWEQCVSRSLQRSEYYRVHLGNPKAWALHSPDHSTAWIEALPRISTRIEAGDYPTEQGGFYDLVLSSWS
jgi:hypothetical protein